MRNFAVIASCLLIFAALGCQESTVRGPEGQAMTISLPSPITLQRGQNYPLTVGIERKGFSGPVTVSVSQLPNGVVVQEQTQTVETDMAVFVLMASNTAEIVGNQQVKVSASGAHGITTTQYLSLTVVK
jgi:hypothetical protein